jgi:FAD:protein FMN transferase
LLKLSLAFLFLLTPAPVTREVYLMGTRCVLTTYGTASQLESYVRILEETESELSIWRPDTVLSRLNAQPVNSPLALDSGLFTLLEEVVSWSAKTNYTFDPTIGKLRFLILDRELKSITRKADVHIDSGAFGKGEGLDRVFHQSRLEGSAPWLIDLGGQVMVYGHPPGKMSWSVDIAHPQKRDVPAMTVELRSGSISTSGVSEQPGHILDPQTGRPAEFKGSVVVWHERALVADILSTALFVMGPEKGLAWAEFNGIAACFLIPKKNEELDIVRTSAFLTVG